LNLNLYDAQAALGFLIAQRSIIEPTVYRTRYPDLNYAELVPVDTSANEWAKSITFFSMDMVGQAQWFSGQAQDVPNADVIRNQFEQSIAMAAIGYQYTLEELGMARLIPGTNLQTDRAGAARRGWEEFVYNVALFGDAKKGWEGLFNSSLVTAGNVAADGTAGATAWSAKSPDLIMRDVNAVLTGVFTGTNTVDIADTLVLPFEALHLIGTKRLDATNQTTTLAWLKENNVFTMQTGRPLTIRGQRGLENAGQGGTGRMMAYRRSPDVVKMHNPMPHRFLDVFRKGPILYEVPGIGRLGGTEFRLPKAARYADGITT
jgi:hypothetical protein